MQKRVSLTKKKKKKMSEFPSLTEQLGCLDP